MDPVINTAAAPTQATGTQSAAGSGTQVSSDFETFLRMLTVQVENQDPLNPVDSTDYATQLATFSGVEQQVLTNDLLKALTTALTGGSLGQLGSYVGMEALVRADAVFDGSKPVALRPEYADRADSAALLVRDATGRLVQRFALDVSEDAVLWEGKDENGNALPAGVYSFAIESYRGEELLTTERASVFSRIEEARTKDGEVVVRLADGTELPTTMIGGLRAPAV